MQLPITKNNVLWAQRSAQVSSTYYLFFSNLLSKARWSFDYNTFNVSLLLKATLHRPDPTQYDPICGRIGVLCSVAVNRSRLLKQSSTAADWQQLATYTDQIFSRIGLDLSDRIGVRQSTDRSLCTTTLAVLRQSPTFYRLSFRDRRLLRLSCSWTINARRDRIREQY